MKRIRWIHLCLFIVLLFSAWSPFNPVLRVVAQSEDVKRAANKTIKFTVYNKTSETVVITLSGQYHYKLTAKPGISSYTIIKSVYRARYRVCNQDINQKYIERDIRIEPCSSAKPSRFWFRNNTGDIAYLTLSGPANYKFTLPKGTTSATIKEGTYSYTMTGCGGRTTTGTKRVGSEGRGFVWRIDCTDFNKSGDRLTFQVISVGIYI